MPSFKTENKNYLKKSFYRYGTKAGKSPNCRNVKGLSQRASVGSWGDSDGALPCSELRPGVLVCGSVTLRLSTC